MRVVTLIENTASCPQLVCEHGLSFYIETGEHRILFDAGQTDAFAQNAEKLGIDLGTVDFAVLSHGHYDHGGGLKKFLEINKTAPVYLRRDAFLPHHNGQGKDIGLNPELQTSDRLVLTEDTLQLAPGVTLFSCNGETRIVPTDSSGMSVTENGQSQPDLFFHEQYLLIEENGKRICFSGCSHKGILNIMNWFSPDVLFGGFHFMKIDPAGDGAARLDAAAKALMQYHTTYYTGHCTGQAQFDYLKTQMGDRLHALSTGAIVEL